MIRLFEIEQTFEPEVMMYVMLPPPRVRLVDKVEVCPTFSDVGVAVRVSVLLPDVTWNEYGPA